MKEVKKEKALTFIEPGPVVLVSTFDGKKNNIMTISWTMAIDFAQNIVITTGPWNHSFETILTTKECVVCIPTADMLETAVGIGMISGTEVDKFKKFGLTPLAAKYVQAPLIGECLACLECKLVEHIERYGFIILHVERVVINETSKDRRMIHAVGDGTFIIDGETINLREMMEEKLPPGL